MFCATIGAGKTFRQRTRNISAKNIGAGKICRKIGATDCGSVMTSFIGSLLSSSANSAIA